MTPSTLLSVHHVGARGVTQALPPVPAFDAEFVNVLYDADRGCLEEVRRIHENRAARVLVYPYCLSDAAGERDFHHLDSAYASSLLPPDPQYLNSYLPFADLDYWVAESFGVRSVERLTTHRLDDLIADGRVTPAPDVLSLDTQGSELDILRGAEQALRGVVCVVTEVEFLPLYQNQPLFGDIARYLLSHGFIFAQFGKSLDVAFSRSPLGARGRRFMATCDALFLRDPRSVLGSDRPAAEKKLLLRKLAFVSVLQGYIEHGRYALEAEGQDNDVRRAKLPPDVAWLKFLAEFEAAVGGGGCFPPTLPEKERILTAETPSTPPSEDQLYATSETVCGTVARAAGAVAQQSERLTKLLEAYGLAAAAAAVRDQTRADFERFRVPNRAA